MSNDIDKPNPRALDNFGDFDESIEGDHGHVDGLLVGVRLKFTNSATWLGTNNEVFTNKALVVTNVRRTEVKWGTEEKKPPLETRELHPGQKFRDLDALNQLCPRSEWRTSYGQLKGPWERQYIVEFCDLKSMSRYSWPTSTIGGGIAVREMVDRVNMKRQFKKREDLWAVVRLSDTFMKTGYDGRQRPDLKIVGWYPLKGEDSSKIDASPAPRLASPSTVPAAEPASIPAAPASRPANPVPWEEEKEPAKPTWQEDMKDRIQY